MVRRIYVEKKPALRQEAKGLLNELRMLSTPAVIDNVTTSGNQEDYVSMGYNACRKA